MLPQPSNPVPAAANASEPSADEVQQIFGQAVVTALAALILLALCFFYFVWKQDGELKASLVELNNQSKNAQQFQEYYRSFVSELDAYSQQHPDVLQVLVRSGAEVPRQQRASPMDAMPLPAPPSQ